MIEIFHNIGCVLTILTIISIGISIGTIIAFNDTLQTEKTYEEYMYKKQTNEFNENLKLVKLDEFQPQ